MSGDRRLRALEVAAAGGHGGTTTVIWEVKSGSLLKSLMAHSGPVRALAYHPTIDELLASAGDDATVKIWSSQDGQQVAVLPGMSIRSGTWSGAGLKTSWSAQGKAVLSNTTLFCSERKHALYHSDDECDGGGFGNSADCPKNQ
jgi:WD40 repeat protein